MGASDVPFPSVCDSSCLRAWSFVVEDDEGFRSLRESLPLLMVPETFSALVAIVLRCDLPSPLTDSFPVSCRSMGLTSLVRASVT
jgi:hypothetical protein